MYRTEEEAPSFDAVFLDVVNSGIIMANRLFVCNIR